jgi:hypothetical protein
MNVKTMIETLRTEREKMTTAIEHLEALLTDGDLFAEKRRGRKNLDAEQRREISERMRIYWANRRKTSLTADRGETN